MKLRDDKFAGNHGHGKFLQRKPGHF